MKQALCDVCAEPIWAEEDERPLCMEHLFTEEFPALAKLTDQVREQEKRPGDLRQDTNRTAHTNNQKEEVVMSKSIELSTEDQTNGAVNALLQAATGLTLYELQWYLRNSTSLSSEMAWDRLGRGHDWTLHDICELATLWEVMPSTLVTVIQAISEDASANDLVQKFELDRRPYIVSGGEQA